MNILWVMLLISSCLIETMSVQFKVVGPDAPLVAVAGEDLVLPCSLQPNISAEGMIVEWIRSDHTGSDTLVHLYEDNKDRNGDQMESYRGRTALFKEELKKGNTSLKLSALQPSDNGDYKCFIRYGSQYDDVSVYVEVKVHFKVVVPAAPLVAVAGEDLVLPCSLQPSISAEDMMVEWSRLHRKDTLVHLYADYKDRNQDQMESYRGRTALFKKELKKGNALLKLSALQPSDDGAYKCFIRYGSQYDDATLYVEVKGKGFPGWKIAIISFSVFVVILTAFIAYILKDKYSKKQLSPTQCSVITYMRLHTENPHKELDLRKFSTSEEGYRRLIPAVSNCRKAQFSGCNLTAGCIEELNAALKTENSSLKELDLSNNNLQDSGVEELSDGLKSSHCKVETLRLVLCNLEKKTCETLGAALLSETRTLKELDLSKNNLRDSGMRKLSDGLKSSKCKLGILRLALCCIEENVCEYLGLVLNQENFLKELDLSNNDLQDSGVELLSAGLKSSHCKLEILRLSGCMITEEGCSSLASCLSSSSSHLTELDLTYNNPEESGVNLLTPHCKPGTLRVEHGGNIRMKTGLKKYGCYLTLDPNTAYSYLSLSEEDRRVEEGEEQQSYPDHPERFDWWEQVLSRERVTGRCYWEAEWSGGGGAVALSYKTISRKGGGSDSLFGGNEKSWSLRIINNSYSVNHNNNITDLPPPPSPSNRVGVYVDCPAGTLSFYTISSHTHTPSTHTPTHSHTNSSHTHSPTHTQTLTHLHTFYTTFTEPLYAGVGLGDDSSVRLFKIE